MDSLSHVEFASDDTATRMRACKMSPKIKEGEHTGRVMTNLSLTPDLMILMNEAAEIVSAVLALEIPLFTYSNAQNSLYLC